MNRIINARIPSCSEGLLMLWPYSGTCSVCWHAFRNKQPSELSVKPVYSTACKTVCRMKVNHWAQPLWHKRAKTELKQNTGSNIESIKYLSYSFSVACFYSEIFKVPLEEDCFKVTNSYTECKYVCANVWKNMV